MPVVIPSEDFELLRRVRVLGAAGNTQLEIAEAVGMGLGALRFKLGRLGFEFRPMNDLRATLTGESLDELLARGEIVPDSPAEVSAR